MGHIHGFPLARIQASQRDHGSHGHVGAHANADSEPRTSSWASSNSISNSNSTNNNNDDDDNHNIKNAKHTSLLLECLGLIR